MAEASMTYRCDNCTQLVPFNERMRVPDAVLRRCQGGCRWLEVGPTDPARWAQASLDGPLGDDGLPASASAG